ncbi:MAG: hypothetical protein ACT6RN_08930 [Agrobacterium sp.]|uniref:hypothetical protein n=1 Tax=Agrobacterium sp. TaxID=361 RepID=UPI004037ED04
MKASTLVRTPRLTFGQRRPSRAGQAIIVPATGGVKGFIAFLTPDFTARRL